jgi:hypothetical protein
MRWAALFCAQTEGEKKRMLTFFSTPKPFAGHISVIQRNAIQSWQRLHPDVEVILFGADAGAAEICREFGLRHEPAVERKEDGTKSLRSIFGRAQEIARHSRLCYVNCDIVLTDDFLRALDAVSRWQEQFLMVGRRWDLDVTQPLDFSQPNWAEALVHRAHNEGFQRLYYNIDYFAFPRNFYREIPDLVIGRNWWDGWLVWRAATQGAPVVDVSELVCAVHQNHDYSYHPQGIQGVWFGEGSLRNMKNAGGMRHLHTIEDANYRLTVRGFEPNRFYWLAPVKRTVREVAATIRRFFRLCFWHPFLDLTRPARSALGLRSNVPPQFISKSEKERLHPFDRSWTPKIQWQRKKDDHS